MESMDAPPKRRSLRDSVLKRPRNTDPRLMPPYDEQQDHGDMTRFGNTRDFFGGLDRIFGEQDGNGDFFSPFGFGGFGNMDRFGEHFNEMMSKFFSDFQPESFADSQYYREDRDLDQDVSSQGLDKTLDSMPRFDRPKAFFRGFSHSESIITRPDGSIEKRVIRKDADGNEETIVTVTYPDGQVQTIEDGKPDLNGRKFESPHISDFDSRLVPPNSMDGLFQTIVDNLKRFF